MPPEVETVFEAFKDLSPGRPYSAQGAPLSIQFSEIDAWSRLTSIRLAIWELRLLRTLDDELIKALSQPGAPPA